MEVNWEKNEGKLKWLLNSNAVSKQQLTQTEEAHTSPRIYQEIESPYAAWGILIQKCSLGKALKDQSLRVWGQYVSLKNLRKTSTTIIYLPWSLCLGALCICGDKKSFVSQLLGCCSWKKMVWVCFIMSCQKAPAAADASLPSFLAWGWWVGSGGRKSKSGQILRLSE